MVIYNLSFGDVFSSLCSNGLDRKGEKISSTSPHLFKCWDNLQQDFSNCFDVGTDTQDASYFTHQ